MAADNAKGPSEVTQSVQPEDGLDPLYYETKGRQNAMLQLTKFTMLACAFGMAVFHFLVVYVSTDTAVPALNSLLLPIFMFNVLSYVFCRCEKYQLSVHFLITFQVLYICTLSLAIHELNWHILSMCVPATSTIVYRGRKTCKEIFQVVVMTGAGFLCFLVIELKLMTEPYPAPLEKFFQLITVREIFSNLTPESIQLCNHASYFTCFSVILAAVFFFHLESQRAIKDLVLQTDKFLKARVEADKARMEAVEALELRSIFIAKVSHEMRTPMNAMLGLSETLLHSELSGTAHELVTDIHTSAHSLLRLVNDVLDYNKMSIQGMDLVPRPFSLESDLLKGGVLLSAQALARKKGLEYVHIIDPSLPKLFVGDVHRIGQVLLNFCSNAIRFTQSGCIRLVVDRVENPRLSLPAAFEDRGAPQAQAQPLGKMWVHFKVIDTGLGIASNELQRCFEPFIQATNVSKLGTGGTGLGLSICKTIAEMMGGCVWAESEGTEEGGSTFSFLVPLRLDATPQATKRTIQAKIASGKRLVSPYQGMGAQCPLCFLLVEDNLINQKVIKHFLKRVGYGSDALTVANNGEQALRAFQPGKFDLILMDIEMPVMGGVQATQELFKRFKKEELPPIVALTANSFPAQTDLYRKIGMSAVLGKPIKSNELAKLFREVCDAKQQPTANKKTD